METVSTIFDNREIAFLIWISILILFTLFHKDTWSAMKNVIVAIFDIKILVPIIVLAAYSYFIVYLLWRLHYWNLSMLKDTIIWFFGVGISLLFSTPRVAKDETYFRKLLLINIKWLVIVEFLINVYVLPLYIEIVLLPTLFLLFGVSIYSEKKPELKKAKIFSESIIALFGTGIFIYIIIKVILDSNNFFTYNNLKLFALPIIMTLSITPYIYLVAIYILYENIFIRINFRIKNEHLVHYTKKRIIMSCFLNYSKLKKVSRGNFHRQLEDETAIDNAIQAVIGE